MFPYTWPFEFKFPTYEHSFVAEPSYNPYKTLVIYAFMFFQDGMLDGHITWSRC